MIKRCNHIWHEAFDNDKVAERKNISLGGIKIDIDYMPDRHTKTFDSNGSIKENGSLWKGKLGNSEEGGPTMGSACCG